ncbi:MAG: type IV pilus modification PilV family protein [Longimicrobiales bacterium]
MRQTGFTLLEVVVASLLLQVALIGVLGTLSRATEVRTRAERIEYTIAVAESVLDSLLWSDPIAVDGGASFGAVEVSWTWSGSELRVVALGPTDDQVTLSGWRTR